MDSYLGDGSVLKLTQSALVLEKLIGRMLTSAASGDAPPAKTP
jgi:phospholipid/cholesterol/gamma-HCH transport system substrate-binding protein